MTNAQNTVFVKALQSVIVEREATAQTRNDKLVLQFGIELEKLSRQRHKALRDRLAALELRLAMLETRTP